MKKINLYCFACMFMIACFCFPFSLFAADTINITVDSRERKYIQYKPATIEKSVNILFMMHGINGHIESFSSLVNAGVNLETFATKYNCLILFPQALPEQNSMINSIYKMKSNSNLEAAWASNTGIVADSLGAMRGFVFESLTADGKYAVVNKAVDDVAFINKIIADKEKEYTINTDSIFMIGISMGGSMTYRYAWDETSRLKAAAVISGYLGRAVDTTKPFNIPLIHFHSHADEIVQYDGGLFNDAIPDLIKLLADKNTHPDPVISNIPDTENDGYTVKLHEYDTKEPQLSFYEITGASHSTVLGLEAKNDINTLEIIMNFFTKKRATAIPTTMADVLKVYPNPASEYVLLPATGMYSILDLTGKTIQSGNAQQGDKIMVSSLPNGIYTFVNNTRRCKLLKK